MVEFRIEDFPSGFPRERRTWNNI